MAGSSGAFFHIADTVIQMDCYRPVDITEKVKKLCQEYPLNPSGAPAFTMPESRRIMTRAAAPSPRPGRHSGRDERLKVKVHGKDGFLLGKQEVDLRYLEQITDTEQTAALGLLLKHAAEHLIDGKRTLPEIVQYLHRQLDAKGLAFFAEGSYIPCGYAPAPRPGNLFLLQPLPQAVRYHPPASSEFLTQTEKRPLTRRSCQAGGCFTFLFIFRERKEFRQLSRQWIVTGGLKGAFL